MTEPVPVPDPEATTDVVIVNWNAGEQLRDCLAALAASTGASLQVVVVDNASTDGSAEGLDRFGLDLTLYRNADNLGFARACNLGATAASGGAILFLNPDTAVAPDAIARARAALDTDPGIGVVGARLVDEAGATQRTCAGTLSAGGLVARTAFLDRLVPRLVPPHFLRDWDHGDSRAVDAVMGAFLMIRRPLFEALDGFDERFFVYWEDADLCARVRASGAAVHHVAEALVRHRGQGTTEAVKDRRLFYFLRAQGLYAAKHHGRLAAAAVLAAALLVQIPVRALRALVAGAPGEARGVLRAAGMLLRSLPALRRDPPGRP